jgi:arylsulfatase A-like enzyme
LSEEGVRFTRAFAHSSHTKVSVASLFTGLIPPSNGIRRAAEVEEVLDLSKPVRSDVLSPEIVTLSEVFKRSGYSTFGVITNPHIMAFMGFGQGFDTYLYVHGDARAMLTNRVARDWFHERDRQRPFFAYVHYMDVHSPYRPPPEYEELFTMTVPRADPVWKDGPFEGEISSARINYTKAVYDAQIRYWDDEFRKFMGELDGMGALDDTILVVVSDHGDEFYEHGGFGHGFTVYDEMIRVPLIMVWKGVIPQGLVRDAPAALIDLFPTLARLSGLDASGLPLQGRDLFENGWRGRRLLWFFGREQAPVYAETFKGAAPRCLVTDELKVILNLADGSSEYFRLDRDREEKHGLSPGGSSDAEALLARVKEISNRAPLFKSAISTELDEETIKELRSLGYVKD